MRLPDPLPSRVVTAHRRHHDDRRPVDECWHCTRGRAMCLSKVTYHDNDEAQEVVVEINRREGWADPVMRYPCDWGSWERPHWHICHCRTTRDLKRARRLQRRLDPVLELVSENP